MNTSTEKCAKRWATPPVSPTIRGFFVFVSACGLAASVLAYIESFSGTRADTIFQLWIILVVGWMVLFAMIFALEYPASRAPSFSLKGFARGMPNWVAPCYWILLLITIVHFVWFTMHSGGGVPAIQDGQYVLEARGQILRVLTQAEYVKLSAAGARLFATVMISCYFVPTMYWWFRRIQ